KAKKGAGLRFLTETITSPSLGVQLKQILTDFPEARWHQYEPVNRDNARAGAVMAFAQPVNTTYDFSKAERILSLGSDFLSAMPGTLRYARDYAAKRRQGAQDLGNVDAHPQVTSPDAAEYGSRLYVVESTPTITGANADHRFSVKPGEMEAVAQGVSGAAIVRAAGDIGSWLPAVAKDLQLHKGASIVIAGDEQSPAVHALAHAANSFLGNVGKTVFYSDPIEANSVDQTQSLRELVGDIDAGKVEVLIILGGNPTYNTPVDLRLDFNRLEKVKLRAHLNLYNNETSEICHWHINAAHYLESWGDARSYDGTVSIVQPLIAPLYEGKTAYEVLALFSDNYDLKPSDIVRNSWSGQQATLSASKPTPSPGAMPASAPQSPTTPSPALTPAASSVASEFESWWRKCLHDGFIPNTALPTKTVTAKSDLSNSIQNNAGTTAQQTGSYQVIFRPDPSIFDGRFANNGWLQELPKPLTKITWDNVALVSPNTATKMGVSRQNYNEGKHGRESYVDTIKLTHRDKTITQQVPVWVMPGQPDDVITIHLGYGRTRAGGVANRTVVEPDSLLPHGGFNSY